MADGNLGVIYYEVEAKTAALVKGEREASASLDKLEDKFKQSDSAAKRTEFQMKRTSQEIRNMGNTADSAKTSVNSLYKIMSAALVVKTTKEITAMADAWTGLQNRLRLVTGDQDELNKAVGDVFDIAQRSSQELDTIATVYQRFAQNADSLGLSLDQVAEVTDTVAKAVAISGSSASSAEAALVQFGQALASGVLRGEELNSVMEQTPGLAKAIADGMGLTVGQLRAVAAEGKITSAELIKALTKAANSVDKQFATRVKTAEQAFVELGNAITKYVGEKNDALGATDAIAKALGQAAEHVDILATGLVTVGSVALARYLTAVTASMAATVRASMAAREKAAANVTEASTALAAAEAEMTKVSANVASAQSDVAGAVAALDKAKANATLTSSSATVVALETKLAAATRHLAAQQEIAATSTLKHAAANKTLETAQRGVVTTGSRLLGILGGPVGIVAMVVAAGAAMLALNSNARTASVGVDILAESLKDMNEQELKQARYKQTEKLIEMRKEAEIAGQSVQGITKDLAELEKMQQQGFNISNEELENVRKTLLDAQVEQGKINKGLEEQAEIQSMINDLLDEQAKSKADGTPQRDPEAEKRLKGLQDELELVKLQGVARARLKAIQDLGDKASPEQKLEAAALAEQIFRIEEARKAANDATKKGLKESEQATKENKKAVADLSKELMLATLSGKALAEAQALTKLNKFASQEDIDLVKALAGAIYELELAEENRSLLAEMDPVEAERQRFEEQLGNLQRLNEAKLLEDQRYYELKEGLERDHLERMRLAEEERFAAQNWQNEMIIKGLNNLEQATASAMTGLISGANNGTQAIQALAAGISQELIASLVKMGMAQVKAWAMGKVAQHSAASGYVASVQGQVAANSALAAQAAFTSTAAIPITGPALAPAAAAKAATAAAALGAPAKAGAALTLAGSRFYGGPVDGGGKMYRVNEGGAPEILNSADGKQYLLPNTKGQVVSNKDATGAAQVNVSVVINSDGSVGASTDPASWIGKGQEIGESVRAIVKDELYRANMPGGMLRGNQYG